MQYYWQKYQHLLLITAGLLVALYIVEPLWLWRDELKQSYQLQSVRADKGQYLLEQQSKLDAEIANSAEAAEKLQSLIFQQLGEGDFKLAVQKQLEQIISASRCEFDRLAWRGETAVSEDMLRWHVDIRFSGSPLCLTEVTRKLEMQSPLIRVAKYKYQGREWQGAANENINAEIELMVWQSLAASSKHIEGAIE